MNFKQKFRQQLKEHAETRRKAAIPRSGYIDKSVIEQRLSEIPSDTRDLTGRIFGDPLPGRSALDRRNAA